MAQSISDTVRPRCQLDQEAGPQSPPKDVETIQELLKVAAASGKA
jgi:hypothetical protein